MKLGDLQSLLLLLQLGFLFYLILHQKAIWEELRVHRQFLEQVLEGEVVDATAASPVVESVSTNSMQGFIPQLLLSTLLRSEPCAESGTPTVEEVCEELPAVEKEKHAAISSDS